MRETIRRRLERVEAGSPEQPITYDFTSLTEAQLRALASIPIIPGQQELVVPAEAQAILGQLERVEVGRMIKWQPRATQPAV